MMNSLGKVYLLSIKLGILEFASKQMKIILTNIFKKQFSFKTDLTRINIIENFQPFLKHLNIYEVLMD